MRLLATLLVFLGIGGICRADARVTLDQPDFYDLQFSGFEVPREVEVGIDAVGRLGRDSGSWLRRVWTGEDRPLEVYSWLLDSRTRRPVWVMRPAGPAREEGLLQREARTLRLAPGRYELYLFSGYGGSAHLAQREQQEGRPLRWWESMMAGRSESPETLRKDLQECRVTLSFPGLPEEQLRRFEVTGGHPDALIRLDRAGDAALARAAFEIDRPLTLRVYSLFEQLPDSPGPADYGWIVDARTRDVVWQADRSRARPAGGSEKNWLIDAELRLPAGRYQVYYGTDVSHSFAEFNTYPPHDPLNWGLTLLPGADFEESAARVIPAGDPPPLIDLAGVGDGERVERDFQLKRAGRLRVLALGECVLDHGGACADRAWITDAATRAVVWELTLANTSRGGGARKNRRFDGLVQLEAGSYVLNYETDGTHSFPRWNSAPPFEPDAWGARIWPGPGMGPGDLLAPD